MIFENQEESDSELDLIALIKMLWFRRKMIIINTVVSVSLGLLIALTSPNEYSTYSILIPEAASEEGSIGGSLGGLASIAGIDMAAFGSSYQSINPELYESVSLSTPFLIELITREYYFEEIGGNISLDEYYLDHYKTTLLEKLISFPGTIVEAITGEEKLRFRSISDSGFIELGKNQEKALEDLMTRVNVEMDWELNLVTIQAKMQDPYVTAQMVEFTTQYITTYVVNYAISKSVQQLESLESQFEDRERIFQKAQLNLASFRDKNQDVTSARALSEKERLESEYNIAFNVYNQLAQQREAIKLQIEEERPIFTILEPIRVPVEEDSPNKLLILVVFALLGFLSSAIYVIVRY